MNLLEVTQRTLEAYEKALLDKGKEVRSAAEFNRIVIEAAQVAGIVTGLPADLGNEKPWRIEKWTLAIAAHIAAAKQPPSEGES